MSDNNEIGGPVRPVLSFKDEALSRLRKDKKELEAEKLIDTIEDFIIDCEAQISLIEFSAIKKAENELAKAKKATIKAEKDRESAAFDLLCGSFEGYITMLNKAQGVIDSCKEDEAEIEQSIQDLNNELKSFRLILEKLKS